MKVKFYLVRNGETLFDRKGRIQGICDSPLTDKGIAQAQNAAKALSGVYFDKAFSSPSERSLHTCEYILEGRGIRPVIEDGLHEYDFGRFEGTRFTSHPDEIRRCFDEMNFSSVDGESPAKIEGRIRETFASILSACDDGDRVLLVTHSMFQLFVLSVLSDFDVKAYMKKMEDENRTAVPNGGIMILTYEDGTYSVASLPVKAKEFKDPEESKTVHFYYVRHGETVFNMWNRMQGWCDSPLTASGIAQAKAASKALRHVHFSRCYTSTSGRTRKTAEIVTGMHDIDIIPDRRLKEVNFGDFEAVVRDSWVREIQERHIVEKWDDVGGENREQIWERMNSFLADAVRIARDGDNILLVSHGAYYLNMLENLFHLSRAAYFEERISRGKQAMPNGGIFRFTYADGTYQIDDLMTAPEEFRR